MIIYVNIYRCATSCYETSGNGRAAPEGGAPSHEAVGEGGGHRSGQRPRPKKSHGFVCVKKDINGTYRWRKD